TAAGALDLFGAEITGQLNCGGAQLQGSDTNGNALTAEGLKVGGSVLLDQGFTAAGAVRLSGAEISGQRICGGAQLQGSDTDGNALTAEGLKVGGSVLLDQGFTTAGTVSLPTAQIGGSCLLVDARLAHDIALRAEGLKIGHELHWAPRAPVLGE